MNTIVIKDAFSEDHISRKAGERLRRMIHAAFKKDMVTTVDFQGVIIASTSFFDEGLAKLAEEGWEQDDFNQYVILKNIHLRDREVLRSVCEYRGLILGR